MKEEKTEELRQQIVDNLLWGIWRSIDTDYKSSYKSEVWQHLEDKIKIATNTDSVAEFFEKVKKLIPFQPSNMITEIEQNIVKFIHSAPAYETISLLRSETAYLVLATRIKNEERKQEFANR